MITRRGLLKTTLNGAALVSLAPTSADAVFPWIPRPRLNCAFPVIDQRVELIWKSAETVVEKGCRAPPPGGSR